MHVNNQLDAQLFFSRVFVSILYMFRAAMCSSSGESIVSIGRLVYVTLCRWPSGMQVSSYNANFEKANKLKNTSRSFSLLSELWMLYTPLTWYEQEDLRHKAHLESLPRALCFYVSSRRRLDHKDTCLSVLQVGRPVYKIHNSALLEVKEFT